MYHEGLFLIWVRIEIQLFSGWVPIVEMYVASIGVPLFLRERAEERYVIQQCKQSLGDLYSRPFHGGIGPGGVAEFMNSGIF